MHNQLRQTRSVSRPGATACGTLLAFHLLYIVACRQKWNVAIIVHILLLLNIGLLSSCLDFVAQLQRARRVFALLLDSLKRCDFFGIHGSHRIDLYQLAGLFLCYFPRLPSLSLSYLPPTTVYAWGIKSSAAY